MARRKTTDNWTIYNCHIHTFNKKHTPRRFIQWVLSDAELGRISKRRLFFYLVYALVYVAVLLMLAQGIVDVAAQPGLLSLLGYPFLLFFVAVMVIPVLLLLVILVGLGIILFLQGVIGLLGMGSPSARRGADDLTPLQERVAEGQRRVIRSSLLVNVLVRVNPASNDIFERTARFLKIAEQPTQEDVFQEVALQYPEDTVFVVLPMDMQFMNLGPLEAEIDEQHRELMALARKYKGRIIPFYAADPRHEDLVERVRQSLAPDGFRGVKIYPNLGYRPDHPRLMEVYRLCMKENLPVLTHCSPGGIWSYGVPRSERLENSKPENYRAILETEGYRDLKLCLAHFGGAEEWAKHLKGRATRDEQPAWVRTIYDMIDSDRYPNLYTDISYTVFTPRIQGLYVDMVDYLRVLLTNARVRRRVLFGSDYYMVERESISEKEVSLLLRSRLGEDLYKQIAHTNPREFLNLEVPAPARRLKKKRTPASPRSTRKPRDT